MAALAPPAEDLPVLPSNFFHSDEVTHWSWEHDFTDVQEIGKGKVRQGGCWPWAGSGTPAAQPPACAAESGTPGLANAKLIRLVTSVAVRQASSWGTRLPTGQAAASAARNAVAILCAGHADLLGAVPQAGQPPRGRQGV